MDFEGLASLRGEFDGDTHGLSLPMGTTAAVAKTKPGTSRAAQVPVKPNRLSDHLR
ncbi:hypothetical protein SAMN04487905_105257 [Actinopolyspora xinjiangensis]|uniref:Uncharacterized protein n=1 Tax=Actinopolyspora xinjiangensis TaxID=405564 RepID=A0A1H0TSP8_9ACTN|nr:hypothetical protein SAMN04487905_105257 [Actinopolyspora xinjiangensis]